MDSEPGTSPVPRVRPGLKPALAVFAVYLVLLFGLQRSIGSDVDYTEIAGSLDSFRDVVVIPIGIVSVFLAVVTTYFGWWRPVLFEARTTPRWLITWPVLAAAAMIANIAADADQWETDFLLTVFLGFAFVGFSEELMTRGLLLTGARAQHREIWAWLISTACFAGMHSMNALNGQDIGTTALQVVSTFGAGTLLYFARRITGTLLVPMLLHGLFDATLTIHAGPGTEFNTDAVTPAPATGAFQTLGAIFLVIALVRKDLRRTNPGPEIKPLLDSRS